MYIFINYRMYPFIIDELGGKVIVIRLSKDETDTRNYDINKMRTRWREKW